MRILNIITKAIKYNIFDDFVENGGVRLDAFPEAVLWQEKAQKFILENLTLNNGSRGGVWVAGQEDAIIIADWKREKPTKILIRDISPNPEVLGHPKKIHRLWNKHNRPFLYGKLKVGFGCRGDQYISEHPDYRRADPASDAET